MRQVIYQEIRDQVQSGDRFEFASNSILGHMIRWFCPMSHTALALSIDEYSNNIDNHKFLLEAEGGGIELHLLSKDLQTAGGAVYWTSLLPQFDSNRKEIADWALQQVGTKYAYGDLFRNALGRVNADFQKLFCSEYYFIALVAGECLPQFHIDDKSKMVVDGKGGPVKSPRPGEFNQYPIFGETLRVII
jgi:uncharacterized protein YycO